ncbi:hypothetical protein ACI8AC_12380 [Geodermatophilus sp. SYSU D00758]
MTEHVTTSAGDTVGYDRRGESPAVVFVAGAGPFRAIDPQTTGTAEILADRGFTTVVHDRAASLATALPDAVRAELPGSQHSWEPGAMADLLARSIGGRRSPTTPGPARR